MLAIFNFGKKLLEKLRRPAYRHAYLAEHVRRGIAYQIRALRDQRGWNQGKFSSLLGKPQSVVCRLEDPSYGKVTVQTLLEVANVYDVALEIRFVTYSSFLQRTRNVSAASMYVLSFKDELGMRPIAHSGAINVTVSGQNDHSKKTDLVIGAAADVSIALLAMADSVTKVSSKVSYVR